MIKLRNNVVNFGQAWFSPATGMEFDQKMDVVEFIQASAPVSNGQFCEEFQTLLLDLQRSIEEIEKGISKGTLYEIKRAAQRDQVSYESWLSPNPEIILEFCDFYDQFALQKKRGKISRSLIASYADAGALHLSKTKSHLDGATLTWHAHVIANSRGRLFQSASHFRVLEDSAKRSMIGRVNRFHHWSDFVNLKNSGIITYDFGGWYAGTTDLDRLKINKFKEEFGGLPSVSYNGTVGVSLRGKFYLVLKSLKNKLLS